jgi:hypothetical protein
VIVDTVRLGTAKPAPGGGVVVPARIGRSGVQIYRRPDGQIVRAYRPADEVRIADYSGAPVTVGHPPEGINPQNWKTHAVGTVRAQPGTERLGRHEFARAELQVSDADTIAKLGTALQECSCAYTCTKDWTPGVTADGEQYDVVFRGLDPNHVALGPAGFARAGREARLIADGEDPMKDDLRSELIADSADAPAKPPASTGDRDKLIADAAVLREENTRLTAELEATKGKLAAAETARTELQTKVDGLPKAIADGVTAELAFRQSVATRLPKDYSFDGKTPREIKVDAIKHLNPKAVVADDASDAWLDGFLEASTSAPAEHDHNATHGPAVQDSNPQESLVAKRTKEAFCLNRSA